MAVGCVRLFGVGRVVVGQQCVCGPHMSCGSIGRTREQWAPNWSSSSGRTIVGYSIVRACRGRLWHARSWGESDCPTPWSGPWWWGLVPGTAWYSVGTGGPPFGPGLYLASVLVGCQRESCGRFIHMGCLGSAGRSVVYI